MELDLKDRVRMVAGIALTLLIAVIASSMVLNAMNRDFNGSPVSILAAQCGDPADQLGSRQRVGAGLHHAR